MVSVIYLASLSCMLSLGASLHGAEAFFSQVLKRPLQGLQHILAPSATASCLDENVTSTLELPLPPLPPPLPLPLPLPTLLTPPKQAEEELLHYSIPFKRQINMLSERCLKSDILLGIVEGVVFEVCKVLVDATSPFTGIHVSHALNAKQDEASYLVRGLLQEITLNAIGPQIGIDTSNRMGRALTTNAPFNSDLDGSLEESKSSGVLGKDKRVQVSLHIDLDALPATGSAEAVASSQQGTIFDPLVVDVWETNATASSTSISSSNTSNSKRRLRSIRGVAASREEIHARAKTIVQQQNERRRRVATIVVFRSFVAPLLIHSLAHIVPSFLSHELIEDIETIVEGSP